MGTIHAESDGTSVTFTTEKAGSAGADSPADTEGGVSADAAGSADTDSSAGADKGSVTDAGTGSEDGVSAEGGLPAAAGLAEGTAENCDYVLNVSSHKFHRPQCKSVSRMKEKNKRFVRGTRETVRYVHRIFILCSAAFQISAVFFPVSEGGIGQMTAYVLIVILGMAMISAAASGD